MIYHRFFKITRLILLVFSIADIILNIEYSENWILFQLIFSKSLLLVQMYFPKK